MKIVIIELLKYITMNKQRLAILITASLGGLATFMPWIKVPILGSVSGTQGDGWITLLLFGVAIGLSLMNDRSKMLVGGLRIIAVIPPMLASVIGILKIMEFKSKMAEMGDNPFAQALSAAISIDYGLYLLVFAGLILPVLAFVIRDEAQGEEVVEVLSVTEDEL